MSITQCCVICGVFATKYFKSLVRMASYDVPVLIAATVLIQKTHSWREANCTCEAGCLKLLDVRVLLVPYLDEVLHRLVQQTVCPKNLLGQQRH